MGLLDGKTAIITGGGTGIGVGIATRFHEEGAKVVICGRRKEKLLEASSAISPGGKGVFPITADVTVEADIHRVIEVALKETGRLDILVNNAGVFRIGKLEQAESSHWDLMMNTNARATWRWMIAVLPAMRKAGGGSIINLSSIAAIRAQMSNGLYGASKAAVQVLSQVMAVEVASENSRVNVICPATVQDTELTTPIVGKENVQARYKVLAPLHPLGRNGKPKDMGDAAVFLASDLSSWITGVIMSVDGGRHLSTNKPPG